MMKVMHYIETMRRLIGIANEQRCGLHTKIQLYIISNRVRERKVVNGWRHNIEGDEMSGALLKDIL